MNPKLLHSDVKIIKSKDIHYVRIHAKEIYIFVYYLFNQDRDESIFW